MKIHRIPLIITFLLSSACSYNVNQVDIPEGSTHQDPSTQANQQWFCEGAGDGKWQCADLASVEQPLPNKSDNDNSAQAAAITMTPDIAANTAATASTETAAPRMPVVANDGKPAAQPTPEQAPGTSQPALLDYPPHYLAVQLIAAHNAATLMRYQQQRPSLQAQQITIMRDRQQWHILLLGVYPSLAEARQAIAAVEDALDESPWIRSVAELQNQLVR